MLAQSPGLAAEPAGAPLDGSALDASVAFAPAALPASAELGYRTTAVVKLMEVPITLHGRTTILWRLDAGHYESHLHIDTGGFDQTSRGQVAADGTLTPDRYEEKRPFHEAETVDIDWAHGRIRFAGDAPSQVPAPGAQDRLSLQFELARLMQHFPQQLLSGSMHTVKLIGTHDIDTWNFSVEEEQSVETGRGAMRAVRFSARRTVGNVEETMDVWLGADLRWLPIRIRMVDRKGSIIDSVLQDATMQ